MNNRICILSQELSNQIAAGEVVERPAAVVKELIENSLDAGSSFIEIDIEKGGIQLIKIYDNGRGIYKDDLQLALCRHATSKIKNIDDLESIATMGFRGEALASISSVSRCSIKSSQSTISGAWSIQTDGTQFSPSILQAAHPVGTTIEIRDLFFNVPARRKFLKKEVTEFGHIEDMVRKLVLCNPAVEIILKHNKQLIYHFLPALNLEAEQNRIAKIFGKPFMAHAFHIDFEHSDMRLHGWIAEPNFSRSQPDLQYCFVNRRAVRDKILSHATKLAYQDVARIARHPVFLLFFELDPRNVDVNVHPTKNEVRFRDSRIIHDFISNSMKLALSDIRPQDVISSLKIPQENLVPNIDFQKTNYEKQYKSVVQENIRENIKLYSDVIKPKQQVIDNYHKPEPVQKKLADQLPALGFAIGGSHGIYAISQNENGIIIIDTHAAHERITYEKLKNLYSKKQIPSQKLLIPITVQLSDKEIKIVEQNKEMFSSLGFLIESISYDAVIVRQISALIKNNDIEKLIRDIISDLAEHDISNRSEEHINNILKTISCHRSVRSPSHLSAMEINALLREMENTPNFGQCNHGRKTFAEISNKELDKVFERGK